MLNCAVLCFKNINKMSTNITKPTLSKLYKNKFLQQLKNEEHTLEEGVDIEDTIACVKSEFFSPIQTRHQRKASNEPVKIRELTNLKRTNASSSKIKDKAKIQKNSLNDAVAEKLSAALKHKQTNIPVLKEEVLVDALWEPKQWQSVLENIRKMRANVKAPVDTMGCNQCADGSADYKTQRFHILVSLMLSSQTKDETTHAAVERLKGHELTPESICKMSVKQLEDLVHPVSFYKTKAKHLQLTSRVLIDQYNSDIPHSIAELVKLPGVGPKMAHLCMSEAWNEVTGIGVDVHVHRISNRLGWLSKPTKEPEQTRVLLQSWLPRSLWREINLLLVGFGQTICTPTRPKCGDCLNRDICPSANLEKVKKPKLKTQPKKLLL